MWRWPSTDEDFSEQTISFRLNAAASAAPPDVSAHLLLILDENAPPRHVTLNLLPLTIGRSAPSEIILEGSTVSRRHCRFERQNDNIVIIDLGSTNGTFIDDQRVDAPTVLQDGARISIGAYKLNYHRRSQQELAGWEALDRELAEANDYVLSVLPPPITEGPVLAEWFYHPCTRLGGDSFGYQMLDSRYFAAYMLDVAGHGAGAALFSVTVANVLRQRMLPEVDFREPAAVIRGLNRMFPMERHNNLFFTMWYGVYDTVDRVLNFATAGHHPAFLLARRRNPAGASRHPQSLHRYRRGSRRSPRRVPNCRPAARCSCSVTACSRSPITTDTSGACRRSSRCCRSWRQQGGPQRLYETVRKAARPGPLEDDFSALALRFL